MSNYHAQKQLHEDEAESDSLWDELSNEQSREIQQHHQRIQQAQNQNQNQTQAIPSNSKSNREPEHPLITTTTSTSLPSSPNSIGVGQWNINIPIVHSNKIKNTFQQTASKFASVAKTAAQAAQEKVHSSLDHNLNLNWDKDDDSSLGSGGSYRGPYAKNASQRRQQHQHEQHEQNGNRNGNTAYRPLNHNCPLEDFGLKESLEGMGGLGYQYASKLRESSSNNNNNNNTSSHTNPASEPLLENNYGMDAELGTDRNIASSPNPNPNQSSNDRKFVLLETFRVKKDGWGAVANLDLFFTSLYNYYYHGGLVPIIGKGIVELISLFFTLWLSVFLFVYLDWQALWKCRDEDSCRPNLSSYMVDNPLTTVSFWNLLMMLYILLFTAYGLFSISTFITNIKDALEAKYIFEDKLGISERKLEGGAVEWPEIVKKILDLQQSGEYRIAIHGQDIKDELVVAQRILRRENFMIAFFNLDILDLTVPMPWKAGVDARSKMKFYSKSLEWSIYFCVLSHMFNHKYQIRPAFCMDAVSLQRRFIFCGVAHILFMPFLILFLMLHFFLLNLYDFRSSKQLGPREWSNAAKWTFREFNELPHVFERRLEPSYQAAEDYLKLFAPSAFISSIGRILVFLSGSLGAVCVALAAVNDAILLHVKIGNWNLLWYVGMLGVAYSIGKSMLPDNTVIPKYHHNLFAEMDARLIQVSNHTHYHPEFWKKRGWDNIIKGAFSELFQYKVKLFVVEVVSIIVAPFILCYSLPPRAMDICSFVQTVKSEVPGTGDHCGFATFDFEHFQDDNWEGEHSNDDNSTDGHAVETSGSGRNRNSFYSKFSPSQRPKPKMGKMEKSFFNFKTVHPEWKCASSGQDLVNKMERYQSEQTKALARERQHHIVAAARQLATLRELEDRDSLTSGPRLEQNQINEQYAKVETGPQKFAKDVEIDLQSCVKNLDTNVFDKQLDGIKNEQARVHFKDLQPTLPSAAQRTMGKSTSSTMTNTLRYDDIGLSTELNSLLNRSTLDPDASLLLPGSIGHSLPSLSFLGQTQQSIYTGKEEVPREELLQRQYMVLENYHLQLRSQHEDDGSCDENVL